VLDPHANAEFRRRLTALQSEIEAAFAAHDDARAIALESERDRLIAELRRATWSRRPLTPLQRQRRASA